MIKKDTEFGVSGHPMVGCLNAVPLLNLCQEPGQVFLF